MRGRKDGVRGRREEGWSERQEGGRVRGRREGGRVRGRREEE